MSSQISILITLIGLSGIVFNKNIIMKIVSLDVMNLGVVMLFVSLGYERGRIPPIILGDFEYADPIPQAVIITAIVIGFSILTLSVALASMIVERTKRIGSDDLEKILR